MAELLRRGGKFSNPLTRRLAGRRVITIWAIVRCRGRRSGRDYSIPVAIGVTTEAFVLPLPFSGAQWILNVMAAGECVIRWNGRDWRATEPEVVDRAEGAKAFGAVPRFALRFLPIQRFMRLRRA